MTDIAFKSALTNKQGHAAYYVTGQQR